jgi:hypothetical protein
MCMHLQQIMGGMLAGVVSMHQIVCGTFTRKGWILYISQLQAEEVMKV